MRMAYFVYILYSGSLDLYYIGSSENPEERLKRHLGLHRGFTGKVKDWCIKYTELWESKTEALKRERQLKGWKNRTRIEDLVNKRII